MAATVALGVFVGHWADLRWGTTPVLTLVGAVVSVATALYGFIRTVMRQP
jgi:hypothetical protein